MSRQREWTTHLGNKVTVEGCCDEHLANTIQWVEFYRKHDTALITLLREEANRRGLTQGFLDRAQFPYRDGYGNWIVWNFATSDTMIVGSYLRG